MNFKTKQNLLCLLLIICYNEVKATLDLGQSRYDLYCYNPQTTSIQVPSKTGVYFHNKAHRDKETILVEVGLS